MNFKNSYSLNFPAIIHKIFETLKRFKSFIKRFISLKFHETLQPYLHRYTHPYCVPTLSIITMVFCSLKQKIIRAKETHSNAGLFRS